MHWASKYWGLQRRLFWACLSILHAPSRSKSPLLLAIGLLVETGGVSVPGEYLPGETDPAVTGFSLSGNGWQKEGRIVAPSGASEFRVIGGKPFWKSGDRYFFNSMTSFTSSDWGERGVCTYSGATCFSVLGGKVFYRIGDTYYCNGLTRYTISGASWGDNGRCTSSGATAFSVYSGKVFYRLGDAYYYNDLRQYTIAGERWGDDGLCTQSGATNFRVSNGKPYWDISSAHYRNYLNSYTYASATWGSIAPASSLPAPDPFYDICAFGYAPPPPAFQADVDGDGYSDEIRIIGFTVAVFHPHTGATSRYEYPDAAGLSISYVKDTDGIPGDEIIILYTKAQTLTKGIDVIHDVSGARNTYEYAGMSALSISAITDTDGTPGNEIVTLASRPNQVSVDVIHDRRSSRNSYAYPDTIGLSISGIKDTDGIAGDEIIILYTKAYTLTKAIDVIHDFSGARNTYDFGSVSTLSINGMRDYDGVAGAEICAHWDTAATSGNKLIVDRTRTIEPGCEVALVPLHHFAIEPIPSPQRVGVPFPIVITARDANNNSLISFTGEVALTAATGRIIPPISGVFAGGCLTQLVRVTTAGPSQSITVAAAGISSSSGTFTVVASPSLVPPLDQTVVYGTTLQLRLQGARIDGSTNGLAFAILLGPPGMTIDAANGHLVWTPTSDSVGRTYAVQVTVTDQDTETTGDEQQFNVKVVPALLTAIANNALKHLNGPFPILNTKSVFGFVNGETTNAITQWPQWTTPARMDSPMGIYPITNSAPGQAPGYLFRYVPGLLTVTNNRSPTARNDSITAPPAGGVRVLIDKLLANDTDADGDQLYFDRSGLSRSSEKGASLDIDTAGVWLYYNAANQHLDTNGLDAFIYRVYDGFGGTNSAVVYVKYIVSETNNVPKNLLSLIWNPADGSVTLTFIGITGRSYAVQGTTRLPTGWSDLTLIDRNALDVWTNRFRCANGIIVVTDPSATSNPMLYYRALSQP